MTVSRTDRLASRLGGSVLGFAAVLVVLTTSVAAQPHGGAGAMGGGSGMGGIGWFGFGPLLWVLVIGAVVVVIAGYARPGSQASNHREIHNRDGALSTLRKQYARGKLSEEEYERRRQKLLND
ncbi:MAG: SHOCT domain-containing protein [Halapricum sp.]